MPNRTHRDPRTKEELLNKMLSYDFSGDVRELGEGPQIERVAPHVARLVFPRSGKVYDLTVHKPRPISDDPPPPVASKPKRKRRTNGHTEA